MKQLLSVSLLFSLICGSCKKDDPAPPPPSTANYQPMTVGSTWTYHVTSTTNFNYIVTATANDTTPVPPTASYTYKVFNSTNPVTIGNEYYYSSGNKYYQFGSFAGVTSPAELNYLQSNLAAGATWSETKSLILFGTPPALPVTFTYTVAEKLATYTVGTHNFTNVMHIKITLAVPGVTFGPAQSLDFYYADGVGRIQSKINLIVTAPSPTTVNSQTDITDYTIK